MSKKTKDVVTLMEKEWPVMTAEFRKLQREQYELFLHKQHDYGPGNISVGTQLKNAEEIKLSLTGLWFRMNDKLQRVKTLLMTGRDSAVKDEPLEDAYLDVSNYGIMATIVGRESGVNSEYTLGSKERKNTKKGWKSNRMKNTYRYKIIKYTFTLNCQQKLLC